MISTCLAYLVCATYRGHDNKHRFVDEVCLSEQTQAKVDEDKILRKLRQTRKHVLACPLCPAGHVVIGIVLERDTAEK